MFDFDMDSLWSTLGKWALKAGRVASRPVLLLWYVMKDDNTPTSDKLAIGAAIAYLILPIDLIKFRSNPLLGWVDEAVSIGVLIKKMSKYITPELEARADAQLDRWFAPSSHAAASV